VGPNAETDIDPSGSFRTQAISAIILVVFRYLLLVVIAASAATLAFAGGAGATQEKYLICGHESFGRTPSTFRITVRPRTCLIMPIGSPFALNADLAGLRWRNWGGATAVATGFSLGMHLPRSHEPVRVTLSRVRTPPCGGEPTLYTRVTLFYPRTHTSRTIAAEASCVAGPGD
jgi:hypothetical protein